MLVYFQNMALTRSINHIADQDLGGINGEISCPLVCDLFPDFPLSTCPDLLRTVKINVDNYYTLLRGRKKSHQTRKPEFGKSVFSEKKKCRHSHMVKESFSMR